MIGIIDYGSGNLFSLECALRRLDASFCRIGSPEESENCNRYILPGVGHAAPAMKRLRATGLIPMLRATPKPVLGICLGMQLLCEHSEEGDTTLLGIVPLRVRHFRHAPKIPHMGWNRVERGGSSDYFYFVHSFFVERDDAWTVGLTQHGETFSAVVRKDNYLGVQFHPEKSGAAGSALLDDWLRS